MKKIKRDAEDEVTTLYNVRKCNFNYFITKAHHHTTTKKAEEYEGEGEIRRRSPFARQWAEKQDYIVLCLQYAIYLKQPSRWKPYYNHQQTSNLRRIYTIPLKLLLHLIY